jgi:hypothetical protein
MAMKIVMKFLHQLQIKGLQILFKL